MESPNDLSLNEAVDDVHSFLDMELETLKSIYINEIKVEEDIKCTNVSIDLHPATADKLDEQYVRMTLQFLLDEGYPEDIPKIQIRNPRGLSEEKINNIMEDLLAIAESKRGNSMLFEMIESAKEHLTIGNRPCGECAICLYGFSDNDIFTKTECYHYFHSHCLARYSKNFTDSSEDHDTEHKSKAVSNELLCPMCRVPIQFSGCEEDYPPPVRSDESKFMLTEEIIDLQRKMAQLYQKQVESGGIIDIEAEKNKYLIEISNVPTRVTNEEKQQDNQVKSEVADDNDIAVSKAEPSDREDSPSNDKKGYRDRNQQYDYRGKNRNYNRLNESRGNYNRQNESRGNYNRYNESRGNYNRQNESRGNYNRQNESRGNYNRQNEGRGNYNRQNESRGNYNRYSDRYNRQSYSDSRENNYRSRNDRYSSQKFDHNRGRYQKNNAARCEVLEHVEDAVLPPSDETQCKDIPDSAPLCDNTSDTVEQQASETRYKPNYNYSPRHNRGYQRRGNNYAYNPRYDGGRRSDKPYYQERQDSDESDKQDTTTNDDEDTNRSEETDRKGRTSDYGARKSNYRSDNYRQNFEYNRERYSDSRNAQRGSRRGFGRRGNYSNDSNYAGKNRYRDPERDHYYNEGDRNFREREQHRDSRYKSNDTQDGYRPKSSRNFPRKSYAKRNDESYGQSSKDENTESADVSSRSPSSDSNQLSVESEKQENTTCASSRYQKPAGEETTVQVESDLPNFDEVCSNESVEKSQAGNGLNIPPMKEKPQGSLRTALNPPPGFANPLKKVIYGLQGANPPPGFNRS